VDQNKHGASILATIRGCADAITVSAPVTLERSTPNVLEQHQYLS
jgi:hypothetical protein